MTNEEINEADSETAKLVYKVFGLGILFGGAITWMVMDYLSKR